MSEFVKTDSQQCDVYSFRGDKHHTLLTHLIIGSWKNRHQTLLDFMDTYPHAMPNEIARYRITVTVERIDDDRALDAHDREGGEAGVMADITMTTGQKNNSACSLYRWRWMQEFTPGYVVYRQVFDAEKCSIEEGARTHKVALFVCELEAQNYCDYRNAMTDKHGTDDVTAIKPE